MSTNTCMGEVADPTLYPGILPVDSDTPSSDALPAQPKAEQYGYSSPRDRIRKRCGLSESGLLSGVGRGDISAHRGPSVGSCSSTVPCTARRSHLGVTASPHAPCPADFVTGSVDDPSPPLGLTSSRRRGWAGHQRCPHFMLTHGIIARGSYSLGVPYFRSVSQSWLEPVIVRFAASRRTGRSAAAGKRRPCRRSASAKSRYTLFLLITN